MPSAQKVVFLKLSGESLGTGNPDNLAINPNALKQITEKIVGAYGQLKKLGIDGLVIVPGAGNIVRGDRFISAGIGPEGAHRDGRLGTLINADRISSALSQLGTPNMLLTASTISYQDGNFKPASYSVQLIREAILASAVVIIGGGNGEDNVTTDNAVAYYASAYTAFTKADATILKGTKYDGVFSGDPKNDPEAKKIKIIGAHNMLADYGRYSVVDKASLQRIIDSKLSMIIYKEEAHDIAEVLQHNPLSSKDDSAIGTAIVPNELEPVFY